ncbi:MAG: hypothetical protein ABEJ72_06220 [Candidatus Aenigmatarchaeota archaeon]
MTIKHKAAKVAKKKLKLKSPRLLAYLPFDKKGARRAMPMGYYIAQAQNLRDINYILREKKRLGTPNWGRPNWGRVTEILENYKERRIIKKEVFLVKRVFLGRS